MKKKVIVTLMLLMVCMSSCVYSLFPIYTDDTIVYLPELDGKWLQDGDEDSYITFDSGVQTEGSISFSGKEVEDEKTNHEANANWTIEFDENEYIIVEGDTVRDPEQVRAYWEERLDSLAGDFRSGLEKLARGFGEFAESLKEGVRKYERKSESYEMKVYEENKMTAAFQVHVVDIDGDLFLDLYPTESSFDMAVAYNLFPVHTFMKLEMNKDEIKLIHFDLNKLNRLFESNLIRMRHENVDGTVLITAQPKEIQKFLSKYSDDESVFDQTDVYKRALSK